MITNIARSLALIATICTIGHAMAAKPVKIKNTKTAMERVLDRALNKHLAYPVAVKQDMTGDVYVSFVIDKEGRVEVLDCASSNERLKEYVIRKLAKIDIGDNNGIWRTTHMRISFKPEST